MKIVEMARASPWMPPGPHPRRYSLHVLLGGGPRKDPGYVGVNGSRLAWECIGVPLQNLSGNLYWY